MATLGLLLGFGHQRIGIVFSSGSVDLDHFQSRTRLFMLESLEMEMEEMEGKVGIT